MMIGRLLVELRAIYIMLRVRSKLDKMNMLNFSTFIVYINLESHY